MPKLARKCDDSKFADYAHFFADNAHFIMHIYLSCSFAAVFSPAKRRQLEQNFAELTPRRPILSRRSPAVGGGVDEEDGGFPQAGAAGYSKTSIIPVLRKTGKRQGEGCGYKGKGTCRASYRRWGALEFPPPPSRYFK